MIHETDIALTSKTRALLQLLEDDSPVVRDAVTLELRSLGLDIPSFLKEHLLELSEIQHEVLDGIFLEKYRRDLLLDWELWLGREEDAEKLEKALTLLSRFQNGTRPMTPLPDLLDNLASVVSGDTKVIDHRRLAWRLFQDLGFSALPDGRESSQGLNLAQVIERRCGLPVSLVCLYILVGRRLDLDSSGCNWPGSYYVRFSEEGDLHVVDCSNHGMVQSVDELLRLQGPSRNAAESIITMGMTSSMLVRRILSKLAAYYRREGNGQNSLLTVELLRMVDRQLQQSEVRGSAVS